MKIFSYKYNKLNYLFGKIIFHSKKDTKYYSSFYMNNIFLNSKSSTSYLPKTFFLF